MPALTINWMEEHLTLLPERAVYWEKAAMLLIADVHLGKASTFRSAGIPIPEGHDQEDLTRLSNLLKTYSIQQLVVLGDWIHAEIGMQPHLIATINQWRNAHEQLTIHWVPGNHDRAVHDLATTWNMELCNRQQKHPPFIFQHHPDPSASGATIAGHIHPCFTPTLGGKRGPRMPCFVFQQHCAILPAFGSFVGGCNWQRSAGEAIYLIVDNNVIAWQLADTRS